MKDEAAAEGTGGCLWYIGGMMLCPQREAGGAIA